MLNRANPPLLVAASLVGLQGLVLVGLAVVGLADLVPGRRDIGISVALFFGAYGVGLLCCARGLVRCDGWTRGPVLITQLIQLGIAWNARGNLVVALPLAVLALVAIGAMLHPRAVQALLDEPGDGLVEADGDR